MIFMKKWDKYLSFRAMDKESFPKFCAYNDGLTWTGDIESN